MLLFAKMMQICWLLPEAKKAFAMIGFWCQSAYLIARTFVWWKLATLDLYHGDGKIHRHRVSFCHRGIFASTIANWVFSFHFFVGFERARVRVLIGPDLQAQLHLGPSFGMELSSSSRRLKFSPKTRKTTGSRAETTTTTERKRRAERDSSFSQSLCSKRHQDAKNSLNTKCTTKRTQLTKIPCDYYFFVSLSPFCFWPVTLKGHWKVFY